MAIPPSGVENNVAAQTAEIDGADATQEVAAPQEVYRLDPATKIPVSRYEGPMWESRKKAGVKAIEHLITGWDEAEYYYNNAQRHHRKETAGDQAGNRNVGKDRRDSFSMTENLVYSTVNAVVPNIYAKNPNVEITMGDEQLEDFGTMLEHLLNRLAHMQYAPGINLKPKVRKSVVRCELANEAYIMSGWTRKDMSADGAREDIARIGAALAEAKDQKEITELEGELLALEESIDLLDPEGPFAKTFRAKDVIWDTAATEDDFSDANWGMVRTSLPTNYLNARYRIKNEDGTFSSAYKPTHVVDATAASTTEAVQEQIDTFKIFAEGTDNPKDYGYSEKRAYERAKRTEVYWCFDKVKRRFYMYASNDWTWPIWVFDDPYKLPNFYPIRRLMYHSDPVAPRTRGEVSHYLDQQDEVNTIVDEGNRMRVLLRDNMLFDSNSMTNKDAEDILLNSNKKIKGIKIPEGKTAKDMLFAPPTPTLAFEHLWDKSSAISAINRISGVGDAMRGEQFKTNTTNGAIQEYSSINDTRLDEKRDAVEDFIGGVMADIMFMWLQFGTPEMTLALVGQSYAQAVQMWQWGATSNKDIRTKIVCSIEGGSTQKPTSAAKKQEALQVGQILGQFASGSPYIIIAVLKIFERAFDSVVITDDDWKMLIQSIQQGLMQGNNAPPGSGGSPQEEQAEGEAPPEQQGNEADVAKKMIQEMVARGLPKDVAIQKVQEAVKQHTAGAHNGQ